MFYLSKTILSPSQALPDPPPTRPPPARKRLNKLKSKRTLGQVLAILDKEKITTTQKELVTVLLSLPNIKSVKFNIVKASDLDANSFGEYDVKNNFIKVFSKNIISY